MDPRVPVLAVAARDGGAPRAVLAAFGCHPTTLGPGFDAYAADWPGTAADRVERALARGGARPVALVALGGAGDANGLREDVPQGPDLARHAGTAVGGAIAEAASRALERAEPFTLESRHAPWPVAAGPRRVGNDPATELAGRWAFGAPTLGGSEEGRSELYRSGLVWEGMTGRYYPASDPQYPKLPPLGILAAAATRLFDLNPDPVLPLYALRIGNRLVVTAPGEPTAVAGHRLQARAAAAAGLPEASVVVLGYAGAYAGYLTTEEEYRTQQYEGASTLYGRHAVRHLAARLAVLAAGPPSRPPGGSAVFEPGPSLRAFTPRSGGGDGRDPRPGVFRDGYRITVTWRSAPGLRVLFAEGPWLSVETAGGEPLLRNGLRVDDVDAEVRIARAAGGKGEGALWTAHLVLPADTAGEALRVRVGARGGFAGFTAPVPPA